MNELEQEISADFKQFVLKMEDTTDVFQTQPCEMTYEQISDLIDKMMRNNESLHQS